MAPPRPIKLVMIRHSKSCSNHVREIAGTHDPADPLVKIAKNIRDPNLSEHGQAMAISYGPVLRRRLADLSVNLPAARVASSGLARAHQTAELLFPDQRPIDVVPHVKEFGDIPENTPARRRRCRPDWRAFLKHIAADTDHDQFVVVAHGSYLREVAWPAVSGRPHPNRLDNLDGFFAEGEITAAGWFKPARFVSIPRAPTPLPRSDDKCSVTIERKIAAQRKMTRYRQTRRQKQSRRSRKQRGGAAMPLTYYAPGSYETRTTDATGADLASQTGNWTRTPLLSMRGGRRTRKQQKGGFAPSVMGAFATNGFRLLPVAGYMGYKQWNGAGQKTRKHRG
jgi:broad specificity phosphatase PhoE